MMIREPSEERGSFRSIPRDDKRVDTVSGSFPIRTGSKVNLQESAKTLEQQQSEALVMISGSMTKFPAAPRHGSMLSSLKAQYRKLRTFKGTIRALINLKRSPLLNTVKTTTPAIPSLNDDQRSAVLEVPRISATAASTVQTQVHKLVADGHVVAEIDSTLGTEVAYRQQGNLDLYTKDNLAKRVSLQQHPHMIALTQRLWNCALRNGDKKLTFPDYETYMLCLHRLILPEFDIGASKELIRDDWKRDSGEQNYLDYPFFHLSMFELVDLWTDTVDPDDYVSLLYCITHCLTYLLDERHVQKSLEDVSNVDILEKSKGVSLEDIKQDLQRELASDAFAYYRDQIKLATKTTQNAEQGHTSSRRQSQSKQRGNESLSRTQSRGSNELSSPRRQSHSQLGDSRRSSRGANESSNLRRQSLSQQGGNESSSRSQSREGKRSSSRSEEKDETVMKNLESTPQHRRSRSGSGAFGQNISRRKFSVQVNTNALNLTADTSGINAGPSPLTALNYPVSSLRKQTGLQRATSPNAFSRGGGVVLNIGMMEGMMISKSIADGKPGVAVSTSGMAAFPRRRSRSVSNSSQHRRDQIMQAVSGKVDSPREPSQSSGLHVSHIEASGSTLRTGIQDPNAPGYLLIPGAAGSGKSREPFTVRAAAVAEAAANMAMAAAPMNARQTFSAQHTLHQLQQHTSQFDSDGSVPAKNISPNFYTNNSSLTAPLITIVSSKAPTPREAPSINKFNLQLQEIQTTRPQNPYEGRSGASISSPRASNAITAQAIGIFISSHQQPVKPPTSPRPTLILSSDHQAPMNPRNLQQYQKNEGLSLVTTGPGSMPVKSMSLAISGRPAAPNITVETIQQEPSKPNTGKSPGLLGENLGSSDGVTVVSHPNGDLKALLSPRYIVAEPVVSHHPSPISNLKQPSVRPHGSTRGFAGIKSSPRIRHQPSRLATGPATNSLQQQRHPSELQELVIAPKLGKQFFVMMSEIETSGLLWWDEELAQPSVSFRTAFFPALLCVCDPQSLPSELSRDELRVVTQFCISSSAHQSDLVTKEDFRRFIARFGPLELSLSKLVACFCVNRELVPWFHGEIGRDEAESVLSTRERSDGAFLVRFSESHPTKFTLTYLKVHSASSNTPGRRELKNCLVNNLGMTGYALTEAVRRGGAGSSVRQRTYPSIGAFIQSSSGRLKYGVASEFSATCNQELAMVRAMQDQQSDSYAAFSTESLGNPEPPANAVAMLFSRTPPSQSSFLNMPPFNTNTSNTSGATSDSYTSFTLDSLAPPTVHRVEIPANAPPSCQYEDKKLGHGNWSDGNVASASGSFTSSDYGSFASFAQQLQPEEEAQPTAAQGSRSTDSPLHHLHRPPAAVFDEYASFANLASTYPHESAARAQEATTFSRSPPSTIQSGFANTGAYGSFASVAVSKPTAASVNPPDSGNPREHAATDDYGSFASLADELEDKRPQWEQTLGLPPPPMVKKSSFDTTKASSTDVYGDFAALSLAGNGASTHKGQTPAPKSLPAAPNSDVYGSFDPTASSPATKTTPTTSALDELNVGMEFYKQKRLDDALLRFMLAQEMARATGDQVVEARALGNLGTVYLDKKNPHQAVRCYQHCLDITRAIEDTKRERTILNNLVLALVASEDFERALACCQVQLETTTNAINRSKIISRMSLLREKMARQTTS
ncbi:hypothetical protein PC120_g1683 [Phytophthora cactorum]|nr:hypothetical protein PC120_g1683 [Phytophthora cactorum]